MLCKSEIKNETIYINNNIYCKQVNISILSSYIVNYTLDFRFSYLVY